MYRFCPFTGFTNRWWFFWFILCRINQFLATWGPKAWSVNRSLVMTFSRGQFQHGASWESSILKTIHFWKTKYFPYLHMVFGQKPMIGKNDTCVNKTHVYGLYMDYMNTVSTISSGNCKGPTMVYLGWFTVATNCPKSLQKGMAGHRLWKISTSSSGKTWNSNWKPYFYVFLHFFWGVLWNALENSTFFLGNFSMTGPFFIVGRPGGVAASRRRGTPLWMTHSLTNTIPMKNPINIQCGAPVR